MIRDLLAEVGRGFDTLVWEPLDLDGTARWASTDETIVGPRPGDLVRVGDRLVVLYEDRGDFRKAAECYREVLNKLPNHPRAKAFLRDAESSLSMVVDDRPYFQINPQRFVLPRPA